MDTKKQKILPVRIYGDPVLRQKAEPVKNIDGSLISLAGQMIESLALARGLGLAAPQVGHLLALCIINLPALDSKQAKPLILINPQLQASDGKAVYQEGCLSFPGMYAEVARPQTATVTGLDRDGNPLELEASEILARVFLHELDHLNGVLFIDHLSPIKRQLLKKRLKELIAKTGDKVR
ncbi:peptide deformylase [candidate division TA06 bacterium]|uniref:Peptide deformylase n=1 Tax=candidate division TA06 bacterium TaxID=2250710 RepID=A0A933MJ66_UNCT6|nr:peptide deformylase [candidate division TA06 bacterium]